MTKVFYCLEFWPCNNTYPFRSNVLGTKFTVYDNGVNPEKKTFIKETDSLRQELAAICYVC